MHDTVARWPSSPRTQYACSRTPRCPRAEALRVLATVRRDLS